MKTPHVCLGKIIPDRGNGKGTSLKVLEQLLSLRSSKGIEKSDQNEVRGQEVGYNVTPKKKKKKRKTNKQTKNKKQGQVIEDLTGHDGFWFITS